MHTHMSRQAFLAYFFFIFLYISLKKGLSNEVTVVQCLMSCHHDEAGPRSAVGNVSGYRCLSDCRSRGREFDPGPVPYFRGD